MEMLPRAGQVLTPALQPAPSLWPADVLWALQQPGKSMGTCSTPGSWHDPAHGLHMLLGLLQVLRLLAGGCVARMPPFSQSTLLSNFNPSPPNSQFILSSSFLLHVKRNLPWMILSVVAENTHECIFTPPSPALVGT